MDNSILVPFAKGGDCRKGLAFACLSHSSVARIVFQKHIASNCRLVAISSFAAISD